jgi:sulfoxide reductase heme-binding subunit YedZ
LVYVAAVFGVLHFVWLVKADLLQPLVFAVVLAVLLGARAIPTERRKRSAAIPSSTETTSE